MKSGRRDWTTKEIQYIQKLALLAETNQVLNAEELAKKLSRSLKSVEAKIYRMQQDGELPAIDRKKAFDAKNRPFTKKEDKRLIAMYKQGALAEEIGEALGRNRASIYGRISRLRKSGVLKNFSKSTWSDEQVELVIDHVKFDENGYVSNYVELAQLTKKRKSQIQQKLTHLRKAGHILVKADRSKPSIASKKAHQEFNDKRFAHIERSDKVVEKESLPVQEIVSPVAFNVQSSKVVQVILTVVKGNDGKEVNQYFSFDGLLLAEKCIEGR